MLENIQVKLSTLILFITNFQKYQLKDWLKISNISFVLVWNLCREMFNVIQLESSIYIYSFSILSKFNITTRRPSLTIIKIWITNCELVFQICLIRACYILGTLFRLVFFFSKKCYTTVRSILSLLYLCVISALINFSNCLLFSDVCFSMMEIDSSNFPIVSFVFIFSVYKKKNPKNIFRMNVDVKLLITQHFSFISSNIHINK